MRGCVRARGARSLTWCAVRGARCAVIVNRSKDFSGTIDMDECMEILFRRFGKGNQAARMNALRVKGSRRTQGCCPSAGKRLGGSRRRRRLVEGRKGGVLGGKGAGWGGAGGPGEWGGGEGGAEEQDAGWGGVSVVQRTKGEDGSRPGTAGRAN